MYPQVSLKPKRAQSAFRQHPWIFSGALDRLPAGLAHGDVVTVVDADGTPAGTGFYSAKSMIAVRLASFDHIQLDRDWLTSALRAANDRRLLLGLGPDTDTTGYRLAYGESDWLPGLVVDRYGGVLVIQIGAPGMDRMRDDIVACLIELFSPSVVFEQSDLHSRTEEGLEPVVGHCHGKLEGLVRFTERSRECLADVEGGQKTGFFLDQRSLRDHLAPLTAGRRTLDLFSYSGATGLAAAAAGATTVTCVDSSRQALDLAKQQFGLNDVDDRLETVEADVFQWLGARSEPEYDLVVLDPPALVKSRKHYDTGRKGYHFLNRAAMRIVSDGGLLATSSCSSYFSTEDFMVTLRRAADQAGAKLSILHAIGQAPDHPLSVYFPEAAYLQSFICRINR